MRLYRDNVIQFLQLSILAPSNARKLLLMHCIIFVMFDRLNVFFVVAQLIQLFSHGQFLICLADGSSTWFSDEIIGDGHGVTRFDMACFSSLFDIWAGVATFLLRR